MTHPGRLAPVAALLFLLLLVCPTMAQPTPPPAPEEVAPDGGRGPAAGFRQLPQDAGPRTADTDPFGATYPWLSSFQEADRLAVRIAPPPGFERVPLEPDSFGHWLRRLPLKPGRPPVHLYDGRLKNSQTVHAAVLDLDVGTRDLQQCADAVIRLRAEYLRAAGRPGQIRFRFTSGDLAEWTRWQKGDRPRVQGNKVSWSRQARPDGSYRNFRSYLDRVFTYAGSYSLSRELKPVPAVADLRPGDVFIQGGFPGHAVIVLDLAVQAASGQRVFLLAQSYMPAQEVHLLLDPATPGSPWYSLEQVGQGLVTPEWSFRPEYLKRWAEE